MAHWQRNAPYYALSQGVGEKPIAFNLSLLGFDKRRRNDHSHVLFFMRVTGDRRRTVLFRVRHGIGPRIPVGGDIANTVWRRAAIKP
jgi:hypothetical protein